MVDFILLHGTGSGPDVWFPWLERELMKRDYSVWMPIFPNPDKPSLETHLPFLIKNSDQFGKNTTVIGHSSSCPIILSFLEKLEKPIRMAILVSGWYTNSIPEIPVVATRYNVSKINKCCPKIIFINSDNDPWDCTDQLARPLAAKLKATMIIPFGEGHMGSATFKQPYKKFPLVLKLTLP